MKGQDQLNLRPWGLRWSVLATCMRPSGDQVAGLAVSRGSPEKQNQLSICIYVSLSVYVFTFSLYMYLYKEIYFKELAYATVGAINLKFAGPASRWETQAGLNVAGLRPCFLFPKTSVFALKAFT